MKQGFTIADLVDDLEPVRVLNTRWAMAWPLLILIIAMAAMAFNLGFRSDLMAGKPEPIFLIRSGLLSLLGFACARTVLAMASPSVGRHSSSWKIAISAGALLPIAGLIVALAGSDTIILSAMSSGLECLTVSIMAGSAIAAPIVLHLRKGAPTSPNRAGWITGLAAGGFGAFAYNFCCPYNDIIYIGFWYSLAVISCAILGRAIIPSLIKW